MNTAEQPNIHGAIAMGWYYDWIAKKWQPRKAPSQRQRQHHSRRRVLLRDLLGEIDTGDSVTKLYAGLLARAVVARDQELMREYGRQIAEQTCNHVAQS
jgi:hypothetical protein